MKNFVALIIAVLLAGAAYYFFVIKKATATTTKTIAPPLTDEQVKGLTDAQIQSLTLDQLKALTFDQLGQLTPEQSTEVNDLKIQLQAKADADAATAKAAANAAIAKAAADAAAAKENARIEALKAKMGVYTQKDIDALTYDQLKSFTDEELKYLNAIASAEYDKDKKWFDRKQAFELSTIKLTVPEKSEIDLLAQKIAAQIPSFFVWEDVKDLSLFDKFMTYSDAQLGYFIYTAWPKYSPDGFVENMKLHNFGIAYDTYHKNHGVTPENAEQLRKDAINKVLSLINFQ